MEIPSKLKLYAYHNLIAIDQLFNTLTGGAADETLSSRAYRGAVRQYTDDFQQEAAK